MRHRRPLIRHLTAAGAVALVAGSALLAPTAAADQPILTCAGSGFMCMGTGHFGTVSASYTDVQPAPDAVWGDATATLTDSPADALDVEPGSTATRNYQVAVPSQASPDSPRRASLTVKNNEGLFANPADMRFHITDATGTELDGGTCSPEEQKLNPGEETTVTCTIPDGGTTLTAFRRGNFGGEVLAAWTLDSQTPPAPAAPDAPATPPTVTVDGEAVTGTVENGTWTASVPVTRQAPAGNGEEATHTPEIVVDGVPVTAPSFRITTKAAADPTPAPPASPSATAEPSASPSVSPSASSSASSSTTSTTAPTSSSDPGQGTDPSASSMGDPGRSTPKAGAPGGLAKTGVGTMGVLGVASLLAVAGTAALRRARRA